ncbi:hypothetical protein [Agrobacterium rubi]|uniref:Uncharacterized protein n=1 Tax=Agrobacterium rubi TaxID=28099 RepID=A0AAE7RAM6_9HYPH|nr:hypothetical protein [Agrobacterium rubi]NTE89563.1 hypothetical protein [Agrobacterium rubi]NTF05699.1 hypothetical protein [Agrobacterium rubi]NTF39699.1 hypothetical protein [Agrobacterium rubi]QTG03523.1 hypothetical protein G6M88_23995 [Agrobacterium rubi]
MSKNSLDDEKIKLPASSKRIMTVAAVFSVAWLLASGTIAWIYHCGSHAPLKINEWGDYAAGASAPLAFLWLVVAVFLQSRELREQRQELAWTRKEFKHNRTVMQAQADEAKNQAAFIKQQTIILANNHAIREAEEIYLASIELVTTRLRQYTHAWDIVLVNQDGSVDTGSGSPFRIAAELYAGLNDSLVIPTTTKTMRTRLRNFREHNKDSRLIAKAPMDFARICSAVVESADKIDGLPDIFRIKARTLELDTLKAQVLFLKERLPPTSFFASLIDD